MTIAPAEIDATGRDGNDVVPASHDWVIRVDRSTLALGVNGRRLTSSGPLRGFVTGIVHATRLTGSDHVTPLAADAAIASLAGDVEGALADLRGQFVIAVADATARAVYVARDPLGAHPLFYAITPETWYFATRPRTLRRLPGVSGDLNRAALADHLNRRWPLREETFFAAIHRVPPGWRVRLSPHGLETRRYWHPSGESGPIDFLPDEEVERFGARLDTAVARALTGRQAGIFLSGGFDSVSVAAVARDIADGRGSSRPLAYSIGFPDPTCDERDVQAGVARQLGLSIDLVDFYDAIGPRGLLRDTLALDADVDAPICNPWWPAYRTLLDRGAQAGIDAILTGEGGDEWLSTTPYLAADLWRRGDLVGLARLASTWRRSYKLTWSRVLRGTVWKYGLRPTIGMLAHRIAPEAWDARRARLVMEGRPDWISPDPQLRAAQHTRARQSLVAADPPGGFYGRESRMFLDHPLMSWLFEEQFLFGTSRGIRYVSPYWDADLLAHVYRVRPERLNEGHRTKALVRQTVDRRFPGLGFRRHRKVTAITFFADVIRREAPSIAAELADFRGLASLDIIVPEQVNRFLTRAWTGSIHELGLAWNLLNTETWVRGQLGRR